MNKFDSFLNKTIKALLAIIICIMLTIGFLFVTPIHVHAESISDYPSLGTSIDTVIEERTFFQLTSAQIASISSDSSSPTLIFNNVYAYKDNQYVYFGIDLNGSIYYPSYGKTLAYTYYYFYFQTGSDRLRLAAGNNYISFASAPGGSSNDFNLGNGLGYITTSNLSPSITFGDSVNIVSGSESNLYEGFRLPAGYLAAIQGSSVSFDMYTDMPEYSSLKQWAYSTQRYGIEASLPSQASFDYDYGTRIIWNITGDTNLLGESYHAISSLSTSIGSGYLMLVNPAYYGSTANIMNADMFNGVVTLSNVSGVSDIRLYSLGSFIGSGGITSDYSTNSAINNAAVVATNGGFYIENPDGTLTPLSELPTYGDTSTDGSSSGLIAKFRAILEGFVEQIENLLVAPVSYIQRLISAANNFFAWLSGLWSWLPSPVSSVLTAVLYIMAVVGALKLLWR